MRQQHLIILSLGANIYIIILYLHIISLRINHFIINPPQPQSINYYKTSKVKQKYDIYMNYKLITYYIIMVDEEIKVRKFTPTNLIKKSECIVSFHSEAIHQYCCTMCNGLSKRKKAKQKLVTMD